MVAMYIFSGYAYPLNFAVMMLAVIAGVVTYLVAQIVFKCESMNFTCPVFTL
jgi:hypothetical protein